MTHGEIPREQWTTFFDDFSKQHEGWIEVESEVGKGSAFIFEIPLRVNS